MFNKISILILILGSFLIAGQANASGISSASDSLKSVSLAEVTDPNTVGDEDYPE